MDLRVLIVCPKCNKSVTVMIVSGWDIKNVRHNCPHDPHVDINKRPFELTYDPPRPVF